MAYHGLHSRSHKLVLIMLAAYFQAVVLCCSGNRALAQQNVVGRRAFLSRSNVSTTGPTPATDETEISPKEEASLLIRADYVGQSEPVRPPSSWKAMADFFADPVSRNCLISAGNTRETQAVITTEELLKRWKDRASAVGAAEPTVNDEIVSVNTGGLRFPGITVETTSLMGTKLLLPTKPVLFPSYEFVLIEDKRKVIGLKPVVWVYSKLVGSGDKRREKETAPMCLSRVTVCPSADNKTLKFKIETFLEIRVNFPAILLKILPVPKEKVELRGRKAVERILKQDVNVSLSKFRDLYTATTLPAT